MHTLFDRVCWWIHCISQSTIQHPLNSHKGYGNSWELPHTCCPYRKLNEQWGSWWVGWYRWVSPLRLKYFCRLECSASFHHSRNTFHFLSCTYRWWTCNRYPWLSGWSGLSDIPLYTHQCPQRADDHRPVGSCAEHCHSLNWCSSSFLSHYKFLQWRKQNIPQSSELKLSLPLCKAIHYNSIMYRNMRWSLVFQRIIASQMNWCKIWCVTTITYCIYRVNLEGSVCRLLGHRRCIQSKFKVI